MRECLFSNFSNSSWTNLSHFHFIIHQKQRKNYIAKDKSKILGNNNSFKGWIKQNQNKNLMWLCLFVFVLWAEPETHFAEIPLFTLLGLVVSFFFLRFVTFTLADQWSSSGYLVLWQKTQSFVLLCNNGAFFLFLVPFGI